MVPTEIVTLGETVVSFVVRQTGIVEKVQTRLGMAPTQRAFRASLSAALKSVQPEHPDLTSILFDKHFLTNGAGPILGQYIDGSHDPVARDLAEAWAQQFGQAVGDADRVTATRAAEAYLRALERELRKHAEFDYIYHGQVLDKLDNIKSALQGSPIGALRQVKDLVRSAFRLGDDEAANLRYLSEPISAQWDAAVACLTEVQQQNRRSAVVLIRGAANSGKTRLAFESTFATLPDWYVLLWHPDYSATHIPPDPQLHDRNVIIFADDLQEYVSHAQIGSETFPLTTNPSALTFQTLLERVRACARRTAVVATCRDEHTDDVLASLPHVMSQAHVISLPVFDLDSDSSLGIVDMLEARGAHFAKEWDGTIGSVVLGLGRKKSQYLALRNSPSGSVLQAMKLLTLARITQLTKSRIQLVCSKVFADTRMRDDPRIWDNVVDELTRSQFVTEDIRAADNASRLNIRKDSYLEDVIADYPNPQRPTQIDQHFAALRGALIEARDKDALVNLGVAYFDLQRLEDAVTVYADVLDLDPTMAIAWQNKANALFSLGRKAEALSASDVAVELDPESAVAWSNRCAILAGLDRHADALESIERAHTLDPQNEAATINLCSVLTRLGRAREALVLLEVIQEAQQSNHMFWHNLGTTLQGLGEPEKALAAFERALELEPSNFLSLSNKIAALGELGRRHEALALSELVSDELPGAELIWSNRGRIFFELGDLSSSLEAYDHALKLKPALIEGLKGKVTVFRELGWRGDALAASQRLVELYPESAQAWLHKGATEFRYELYEKAVLSFECAIVLDGTLSAAWNNKGAALARLGRIAEAADAFRQACETNPVDEEAPKNLEKALAALRRKSKTQVDPSLDGG